MSRLRKVAQIIALIAIFGSFLSVRAAGAQEASRYFPETKQTIKGRFLEYWTNNGGLMQQGYPISAELQEQSNTDGKTYTVQYFERAVFEKHPENSRPYDVLLSLLGVARYKEKYPNGAPNQRANDEKGSVFFQETGKRIGGSFLVYFNQFGGVPQQGLPISDEFQERSDLDGKIRVVQYFERAVFEWNPDNKPPFNVLLAQLGTFAYKAKQGEAQPQPPLLEPSLPQPADSSKGQLYPHVSGRYMVWNEGNFVGPVSRGNPYEFDIRALDLATNQPVMITNAPGNQFVPALDGSLVAWKSENFACGGCPTNGLYATDLATGQVYIVALDDVSGNPLIARSEAVAGRNVAWVEFGNNNRQRLMAKNVDTGASVEIRSLLNGTPDVMIYIQSVQAGGRFLVWSEVNNVSTVGPNNTSYYPYSVFSYDFTTGKTSTLLTYDAAGNWPGALPTYSYDAGRLVLSDRAGNLTVMDLVKGTQVNIPYSGDVYGLSLYGNRLLINSTESGADIDGLDLSKPEQGPVHLLKPAPDTPVTGMPNYTATIAGDWLVWSNSFGPGPRLQKQKLDLTPPADPGRAGLPTLPPPDKYRAQYVRAASDRYFIYLDCPAPGRSTGQRPCVVHAFDLVANQTITFAGNLGLDVASDIAVSGSLLAWRISNTNPAACPGCPGPGIYTMDIAAGGVAPVVTGTTTRESMAIFGRTAVWIEKDENSERVMGKDLDSGEYKNYQELGTTPPSLSGLQISEDYLAWIELDTFQQDNEQISGKASSIKVYDRHTGDLSTVFSFDWDKFTVRSLHIALDGHRIAVRYGSTFFVRDLQNDTQIDLPADTFITSMQLRRDTLAYGAVPADPGPYGGAYGAAVYAIDLRQPGTQLTLIPRHVSGTENYFGVLANKWLIYSNVSAQQPRLQALTLPDALR